MTAAQDAIAYADLNLGLTIAPDRTDSGGVDLNVGVPLPVTETIRQQAIGWGVTPARTRQVTRKVLVDDVAYADLDVI